MKPRPDLKDRSLSVEVARALLPQITAWGKCRGNAVHSAEADEHTVKDLVACMETHEEDGYNLAKTLERDFSWGPDADLVRILNGIRHLRHTLHDMRVEEWVKENGLHLDLLDLGTEVVVDGRRGRILDVFPKDASYHVAYDLGSGIVPREQVSA